VHIRDIGRRSFVPVPILQVGKQARASAIPLRPSSRTSSIQLDGAFFTVNSGAPLLNDNGSVIFNGRFTTI
jgi:hypothetical protein